MRSRKTISIVMIILGLGIFMLPFTPRWMVDWALSGETGAPLILISPLTLIVTASLGSALFLIGIWLLYKVMREDSA